MNFPFASLVCSKNNGNIQKSDKSLKLYCYIIEVSQHRRGNAHTSSPLFSNECINKR